MSADDSLETILRPWMHRAAPPAPPGLLHRVMREVDAMSERSPSRSWISWFLESPTAAWALAAASVGAVALAVAILAGPTGPTPVGPGTSASPTPTPAATPSASPTPAMTPVPMTGPALIDTILDRWNAGDAATLAPIYADVADLRSAIGAADWTSQIIGRDAIIHEASTQAASGFRLTRTGAVLQLGDRVAFPITYSSNAASGNGIVVMQIVNGFVVHQLTIADAGTAPDPEGIAAPQELVDLLDAQLAARNRNDGPANAALFTPDGAERDYLATSGYATPFVDSGRAAIAASTDGQPPDFAMTRVGDVLQQGAFVVYPYEVVGGGAAYSGFLIAQLDADNLVVNEWLFLG